MTTGAGPAGGLPPDSVRGAREQITEAVAALLVRGRGLQLAAWLMLDSDEDEGDYEGDCAGEDENAGESAGCGADGPRARAVKRT
ncbi:hypothetical protein [Kitasatospora griseola]|uniref:hypothetical protein n=1 Tax=Kitasatospora griseola TaxID=2064 RepID=UPI00380FB9CC